jgi:hypothetical protein
MDREFTMTEWTPEMVQFSDLVGRTPEPMRLLGRMAGADRLEDYLDASLRHAVEKNLFRGRARSSGGT